MSCLDFQLDLRFSTARLTIGLKDALLVRDEAVVDEQLPARTDVDCDSQVVLITARRTSGRR